MSDVPATSPREPSPDRHDAVAPETFAAQAESEAPGLLREFWDFLKHNKKWWLGPIVVTLLVVSFFLIIGGSAAPFIYALF